MYYIRFDKVRLILKNHHTAAINHLCLRYHTIPSSYTTHRILMLTAPSTSLHISTQCGASFMPNAVDPYPYQTTTTTTTRTIKLLYVPDPSRKFKPELPYDLAWVKRNLTDEQLTSIKHLQGYYHKRRPNQTDLTIPGTTYMLTEWVSHLLKSATVR